MDTGGLSWTLEPTHFPAPITRWTADLFVRRQTAAIRELCERYGLLLDGIAVREFHGRAYTTVVPLGGKPRPTPPSFLVPLLCRVVPDLRARIKRSRAAEAAGDIDRIIDRWLGGGEAAMLAEGQRLLEEARAARADGGEDDATLASLLERALELGGRGVFAHFELHGAGVFHIGALGEELVTQHGWTPAEFTELFTGLSDTSTGPAAAQQALVELVRDAGADGVLAGASDLDAVRAVSADVTAAIDDYLDRWGARAVRYEVGYPTVAERPDWLLRALQQQGRRRQDPDLVEQQARVRADREAALLRTLGDTAETRARLRAAHRTFPVREGNETATIGIPVAALRHVGLLIGSRWEADGLLERVDDIFDLEPEAEVLAVLRGRADAPPRPSLRDRAIERRQAREAAASVDAPPVVGPPPSAPPSVAGFPPDIARNLRAILWYTDKIFGSAPPSDVAGGAVRGEGVAPGIYEGTARVVLDEAGFDRIVAGDVLVCPITSPVWSMVFPLLGALVCDTGGVLSHPAIIAREFGIPAVVATGEGTARIPDGARVRVDGDTGEVTVLDAAPVAIG